jgi:hypothetical protein
MRKSKTREILGRLPEINYDLSAVFGVTPEFVDGFTVNVYDMFEDLESHNLPLAHSGLRHLASSKAQFQTNPSYMINAIPVSYAEQKKKLTKGFYKSLAAAKLIEENRNLFIEKSEAKIAASSIAKLARQSLIVTIDYPDAVFMPERLLTQRQIEAASNLSEYIENKNDEQTLRRLGMFANNKMMHSEGSPTKWSAALSDIFFAEQTR